MSSETIIRGAVETEIVVRSLLPATRYPLQVRRQQVAHPSIENEAETAEAAWLPYLMLPDGSTVADEVTPRVREAYRSGVMPDTLLPGLPRVTARVIELPGGRP